jgi:hypothetical protein
MKKLTLDVAELKVDSFESKAPHFNIHEPKAEALSGMDCSQPYFSCRIPCPPDMG